MGSIDWCEIYYSHNVNEKFALFFERFSNAFEAAFPIQKTKIKSTGKPWINANIINESEMLKDLHWLLSITGNDELKSFYNRLKKDHRKNIELAKKDYNDRLLRVSKNKTKTAWNIITSEIEHTKRYDITQIKRRKSKRYKKYM